MMSARRWVLVAVLCPATVSPGRDATAPAEAEDGPRAAIAQYVRLLEAEDYAGFLRRVMAPADLARTLRKNELTLDQLASLFKPMAGGSLRKYRLLRDAPAVWDPTFRAVRLYTTDPDTGRDEFSLLWNVGGRWYGY